MSLSLSGVRTAMFVAQNRPRFLTTNEHEWTRIKEARSLRLGLSMSGVRTTTLPIRNRLSGRIAGSPYQRSAFSNSDS
jgi:hypothetical protein